ncbi:unnamed protein product [Candida verbasci]|uniref:Major facilitator superfamily (MFS) profile domain-containing protein n=1 Tax=Candida verbasci TaxID=1227364 RepID=A0A9W4TWR4_9ASCO|nr:unnamed protein product [Candida verbasci]
MKSMQKVKKMYNSYAIGLAVSLFSFIAGMELYSYLSIKNSEIFTTLYEKPTKFETNLLKSCNYLGAIAGSVIGGEIAEHFGFIKSMECLCIFWIIGIIFTFVSDTISMLILGKIINGVAVGITFISIPIYQFEIIPIKRRGRVLSLFLFVSNLGNLISFLIPNMLIEQKNSTYNAKYVRLYWLIELIPLIFAIVMLPFIPESPKWLAVNSDWSTAADVLESIEIKNSSTKDLKQQRKINLNRAKLGDKHFVTQNYSSTSDDLKSCSINRLFGKRYIRETSIAIIMKFLIDFIAISNISESIDYISESCQISTLDDFKTVQTAQLIARVVFSTIPILISDVMRRKDILVYGTFLVTCIMFSYMVVFLGFSKPRSVASHSDWFLKVEFFGNSASTVLALTGLLDVLYYTMIIPISWLYTIESLTHSTRIRGWIVVTSLHWLFESSISLTFPFLFQHLNGWIFFIISFICLITLVFTTKLQETKGKILIESGYRNIGLNSSETETTVSANNYKSALYDEKMSINKINTPPLNPFQSKWELKQKLDKENDDYL